jgi:tetratricopeptide (TPR) repeat protein
MHDRPRGCLADEKREARPIVIPSASADTFRRSLTIFSRTCSEKSEKTFMPDSPALQELFDDANGHLALGELEEAVTLYRRCVEIDPGFFDGWHALGMALLKTGHTKEAIGCGLQAVTLQPNDLLAWTSLSQMYVRDGNIPEAESAKGNARILSLGGKVVRE